MFTGLVAAVGVVRRSAAKGDGVDLEVDLQGLPGEVRIGDSIALSGVCCTVVDWRNGVARFHLTAETLRRTWLGDASTGAPLNVEAALRASDPLGGHLVQGHVDGRGRVIAGVDAQLGGELVVEVPRDLDRYCVEKGSIALDGVSLTIAAIGGSRLRIAVIPHTAQATTLGRKQPGEPLHVEVDVVAKYVEKMLQPRLA